MRFVDVAHMARWIGHSGPDRVIAAMTDVTRAIQLYLSAAAAAVKEARGNQTVAEEKFAEDAEKAEAAE